MRSDASLKTRIIASSLLLVVALVAWAGLTGARLVQGQTATPSAAPATASEVVRTVTVIGYGEAKAIPDQATVTIGVENQATTADAALEENNKRMAALLKLIQTSGVANKDVQTSSFHISPVYGEARTSDQQPPVTGYRVGNQVVVTVRVLDSLGPLLDQVVKAGANQIYGISFGLNNSQALMDQAREQAMNEAARKARQMATLGQAQLGPVVTIIESGASSPPVVMARKGLAEAMDAAAVPVAAGEATIGTQVQVTYMLR
jgi:uncharacterized protein YggE